MILDPRGLPDFTHTLVATLADPASCQSPTGHRAPRSGARRAGVLIMLGEADHDVVFTERAASLRNHPGQISFPGGSIDEGESAVEAALREAWEEVGLPVDHAQVLGQLPPAHVAASGFDVAGIVALWDGTFPIHAVNAGEVAQVLRYPVEALADPAHRITWRIPGRKGPGFLFDDMMIWGFTAFLTDTLLQLGGWEREWDTSRVVDVPSRFFRR